MFCSKCGKQLIPNAAFCANCGSRINAPQMQTPQNTNQAPQTEYRPPQQSAPQPSQTAPQSVHVGEDVLFVLKASRRLSLTQSITCHIVFKQNWLVLAHLTDRLTSVEMARLQESLKAQNLGVMKRSAAQMRFWGDFYKRYYTMTTDAILAEDPTNQALNYQTITSIDYKCAYDSVDNDGSGSSSIDGSLYISLPSGETLKFAHQTHHDKKVQEMLTALFGPRLKYKK